MTIDPRLIERRKTVAEEKAHRSMRRLLRFLILILIVGALLWLAFSPWLSVARVRTAGVVSSDVHATLAREEVVAGTPMVFLRTGEIEDALEADPWVRESRVTLDWPDEVLVRVVERVPVVWVESAQGWTWRAADGVAVPGPSEPGPDSPGLIVTDLAEADLDDSQLVMGAAEFVAALPSDITTGLRMTLDDGELWANVAGFPVRLGRPVEMEEKALSLTALLREDIPEGSTLVLIAPTNPSVDMPGDDVGQAEEPEEEGEDGGEGSHNSP